MAVAWETCSVVLMAVLSIKRDEIEILISTYHRDLPIKFITPCMASRDIPDETGAT